MVYLSTGPTSRQGEGGGLISGLNATPMMGIPRMRPPRPPTPTMKRPINASRLRRRLVYFMAQLLNPHRQGDEQNDDAENADYLNGEQAPAGHRDTGGHSNRPDRGWRQVDVLAV